MCLHDPCLRHPFLPCSPTGFILFIWLTTLVVTTPPAPLAFSKHHIEELWHAVKDDLHGLKLPGLMHPHHHAQHHPSPASAAPLPPSGSSAPEDPASAHTPPLDHHHAHHHIPTNLHEVKAALGSGVQACLASAHSVQVG